jgi:hypothetical protein
MRDVDIRKGDTVRFISTKQELSLGVVESKAATGVTIRVGAVQGTGTRNGRPRLLISGTLHRDVPFGNVIRKVR